MGKGHEGYHFIWSITSMEISWMSCLDSQVLCFVSTILTRKGDGGSVKENL